MPDLIGGMGDPKQVGAMIDPIIQKAVATLASTVKLALVDIENSVDALPGAIVDALDGMTITLTIKKKP